VHVHGTRGKVQLSPLIGVYVEEDEEEQRSYVYLFVDTCMCMEHVASDWV